MTMLFPAPTEDQPGISLGPGMQPAMVMHFDKPVDKAGVLAEVAGEDAEDATHGNHSYKKGLFSSAMMASPTYSNAKG